MFKKYAQDSIASDYYTKALNTAFEINDTILITETSKKILFQLSQNRGTFNLSTNILNKYKNYLYDVNEKDTYLFYKYITEAAIENKEKIIELKSVLALLKNSKNYFLRAKCNQMIGIYFSYFKKENDSAIFYMQNAQKLLEIKNYQLFKNELFGIYGNIGQYVEKQDDLILAKTYYEKANKIKIPKYRYLLKVKLNEILSNNSLKRNLKDSAYYYLKQSNFYKDTLNEYNKSIALNAISIKYQTAEKEKHILLLEKENITTENNRKQNKNLFIAALLFILFGGTIAVLSLKSSKRKRELAVQKEEVQKQKNVTLLKEQELTTINALVEGQEKERKRIAEDLHDNIGSVLATLKLHFENLQINREKKKFNQDELFQKTEKLIDEAYLKVRSIAHAKNSGVIANQGLLVAIQMMAEKITSANTIKIDVIDFGLDKRIENSLEIGVFRIIQELITNILKHAKAKNATINISQYENALHIIVEDDGKGFHFNKSKLKNGMGINSIITRIEHLKGTFEIDSTLHKGTSILINIPIT